MFRGRDNLIAVVKVRNYIKLYHRMSFKVREMYKVTDKCFLTGEGIFYLSTHVSGLNKKSNEAQ